MLYGHSGSIFGKKKKKGSSNLLYQAKKVDRHFSGIYNKTRKVY